MAILIFSDETYKTVDYNKAAQVLAILEDREKPKNKMQADFVSQVKDVLFEKTGGGYTPEDRAKMKGLKER